MLRLYVANLAQYNAGRLVGKWLELPMHPEDIQEAFDEILGINDNGQRIDEEYAIHDYETDVDGLLIGEYANIAELNEFAEAYDNLESYDQDVLASIIEASDYSHQEALEILTDGRYIFYPNCDLTQVAEQMLDEGCWGDPKQLGSLVNYIDYDLLGRDLGFDGYTETRYGVIRID